MAKMLAFRIWFNGADWCDLVHGETRGKAKYRFLRVNPESGESDLWNEIRMWRLPGQDDKPFTYDNAAAAGFHYSDDECYVDEDHFAPRKYFYSSCDCEICKEKRG